MKKALLIAGLLSCAVVPVSRAAEVEKPKQEAVEITEQDIKRAQDAIVAVLTEAISEADDSDKEPATEA